MSTPSLAAKFCRVATLSVAMVAILCPLAAHAQLALVEMFGLSDSQAEFDMEVEDPVLAEEVPVDFESAMDPDASPDLLVQTKLSPLTGSAAGQSGSRLYVRGGSGSGGNIFSIEYDLPIGQRLGLSLRLFSMEVETEMPRTGYHYRTGYYYTYSYWWSWYGGYYYYPVLHTYHYSVPYTYYETVTQRNTGGEAVLTWKPGKVFSISPYLAAGLRLDSADCDEEDVDDGVAVVVKLGVEIPVGIFTLRGEYAKSANVDETIADIGIPLSSALQLHLFAEQVKLDLVSSTMYGGGISLLF